jgi:hypothetical protein
MLKAKTHIDENTLERYLLSQLAESSVASVEQHLLICGLCRVRLAESETYVRAMKAAAQALAGDKSGPRQRVRK